MFKCGELHGHWKGDAAHEHTKRERAQRMYTLTQCEMCDNPAVDRHHIDTDTGNNKRDNIMLLCRKCHMTVDGRLDKLQKSCGPTLPPKECSNCHQLAKPLRKGLCHKCNEYFRRNGYHWPLLLAGSRSITVNEFELIKELRSEGYSYRKIATCVKASCGAIHKACLNHLPCHKDRHAQDNQED